MVYEHTCIHVCIINSRSNVKLCMYVHACVLLQKHDELYSAAETGNVAETKRLIQSGVYVDFTTVSYKKVITMHGYF